MPERASILSSSTLTEQTTLDFTASTVPNAPAPFQVAEKPGWYRTIRSVSEHEVIAFSCELLSARFERETVFDSPSASKPYFIVRLAERLQEVFVSAFLDNCHRLIAYEELFFGTIDGCSVHPREVVRRALFHNAAAVMVAHNHPSGHPEPSKADEILTQRLKEALALIDVRVLDHLIVGGGEAVSLADRGLL